VLSVCLRTAGEVTSYRSTYDVLCRMARGVRESENVISKRAVLHSDCNLRQNSFNYDKKTMSSKCHYQHNRGPYPVVCASTRNGAMDRDE
jgi:DNA/RNA endonuclease YhcR with UshA esterase domain